MYKEDGGSCGGDKDAKRRTPDMCQRRETQHKGLTDGRPEKAIVPEGLTSLSTDHVVARTTAIEEEGITMYTCSRGEEYNHQTSRE